MPSAEATAPFPQPTPVDAISGVSAGDPLGPVAHMRQAQYAQAMAKTQQQEQPGQVGVDASAAHSALLQNAAANGVARLVRLLLFYNLAMATKRHGLEQLAAEEFLRHAALVFDA